MRRNQALGISGAGFLKEIQRENQHERPKTRSKCRKSPASKNRFFGD